MLIWSGFVWSLAPTPPSPIQLVDVLLSRIVHCVLPARGVRVPLHPRRDRHLVHAHHRARRPGLLLGRGGGLAARRQRRRPGTHRGWSPDSAGTDRLDVSVPAEDDRERDADGGGRGDGLCAAACGEQGGQRFGHCKGCEGECLNRMLCTWLTYEFTDGVVRDFYKGR